MSRFLCAMWAGLLVCPVSGWVVTAAQPAPEAEKGEPVPWHTRYAEAMEVAMQEGKMLVIYFHDTGPNELCRRFESESLGDVKVVERLRGAVNLKVPVDTAIRVQGEEVVVLEHDAFAQMQRRPGVAILDFVHRDGGRYGCVVSAFPFTEGRRYTVEQMAAIGDPSPEGVSRAGSNVGTGSADKAHEPPAATPAEGLEWSTDYAQASEVAKREGKMLLICFHEPGKSEMCEEFASETLARPDVLGRLKRYVRARLSLDAKIRVEGNEVPLLRQAAFREMLGRPGLAIIDFAHKDAEYYAQVVSEFPFLRGRPYSARQVSVILDLPPGTLTQRTLIYAVRTHPDGPASTDGQFDPYLAKEASLHSEHQARIRLQGHHNWDRRFHRINARLPGGLLAAEVCAESWPGETLVEAAIECVRCWRLSSGHWSAVRAPHRVYGYDMKRGANGVWYATGIFGRR